MCQLTFSYTSPARWLLFMPFRHRISLRTRMKRDKHRKMANSKKRHRECMNKITNILLRTLLVAAAASASRNLKSSSSTRRRREFDARNLEMQEHTQKKNIREIRRRSDDVELMEMGCNDRMEIQGDENDFIYC